MLPEPQGEQKAKEGPAIHLHGQSWDLRKVFVSSATSLPSPGLAAQEREHVPVAPEEKWRLPEEE
jgi:hypothetical protein